MDGKRRWLFFSVPAASFLGDFGLRFYKFSASRSVVSNSSTPWTVAHQAPLSMEFSRPESWSGLPFYVFGCLQNKCHSFGGGCVLLKMLGLFYTLHELFSSGLLQHVGVAHTLGTLQAIRCWPCVEDSGWWMVYVTINESCCFQDVILPDSHVLCVTGRREGLEWHSQRAASVLRLCASSGLCSWGNSSLRTPVLGRLFSKNPLLFLSEMKKAVLQKALGALVEMENFKQS